MAATPLQNQQDVYSEIVISIVQSIKNGDPTEEIRDMLIESAAFKNTLREWKDDRHQLNALQCAIVHRHAGAVKLLSTWDFTYQTICRKNSKETSEPDQPSNVTDLYQAYKEKQARLMKVSSNTNVVISLNGESSVSEKQRQFQKLVVQDSEKLKINSPVHLACKLGDLDILKILVSKDDTIESQQLLEEKSVVTFYDTALEKCPYHMCTKEDRDGCVVYDGRSNGLVALPAMVLNNKADTDVNKNEQLLHTNCLHSNPVEESNDEVEIGHSRTVHNNADINRCSHTEEAKEEITSALSMDSEQEMDVENNQGSGDQTYPKSISGHSEDLAVGEEPIKSDQRCNCITLQGNTSELQKTPFEVCIDEKQLQCASYLARILYDLQRPTAFVKRNRQHPLLKRNWQPFMVQEINAQSHRDCGSYSRFYFGETTVKGNNAKSPPQPDKSLLHVACFLGNAGYLDLLLRNGFRSVVNERDEASVPPLFVAISSSVECVKLVLMYGADVNATVACQNALHKLYDDSTEETSFMTECTKVLIWAGINVNGQDSNNNTPLDYLASDFSKESLQMTQRGRFVSLAERNQHARKCMELLLEAGARIHVPTPNGTYIDHTIGHTLLLNCSRPVSSFFSKNPKLVYLILELYFQHGQNPNILPVNNESNLFSQLISVIGHCLSYFEDELQTRFMHLFIINGADLNHRVPPPRHAVESGPIRIWNVYPLILALQEKLPVAVLELLANFMSLDVLSDCVVAMSEGQIWLRFALLRGNGAAPGVQANCVYTDYKTAWDNLALELQTTPRSLRHCTKLVILDSIKRKGNLLTYLPIPKAMQLYLCSEQC